MTLKELERKVNLLELKERRFEKYLEKVCNVGTLENLKLFKTSSTYRPRYVENYIMLNKYFKISFVKKKLIEAYSKTNTDVIIDLVNKLLDLLHKKISLEDFSDYQKQIGIGFQIQHTEKLITPFFDPTIGMIVIVVDKSVIERLIIEENYKNTFIKILKSLIVHEDTHKQQFLKYKYFSKNYKEPDSETTKLSAKNVAYYNQVIEADAYGREVGYDIRKEHPGLSTNFIFDKIKNKEIGHNLIDIYNDPKISNKAFNKFWRAVYDYLEGEEDAENDQESSE